jgi:excisionase family DNA binding protein
MITDYMTLECLALNLSLPKAYLRRLLREGKLPYIDTGNGRKRFNEAEVRQALAKISINEPLRKTSILQFRGGQ